MTLKYQEVVRSNAVALTISEFAANPELWEAWELTVSADWGNYGDSFWPAWMSEEEKDLQYCGG